jgi:hypothetical protein
MKKELRQKVWNKYNKRCAYCGTELEYKQLQVDHIDAKYLGGSDELNNYNPSCRGCNFYKSTFTIDGFRTQLKSLHERLFKIFIVKMAVRYGILSYKPFSDKFYFETLNKALIIDSVIVPKGTLCGCGAELIKDAVGIEYCGNTLCKHK